MESHHAFHSASNVCLQQPGCFITPQILILWRSRHTSVPRNLAELKCILITFQYAAHRLFFNQREWGVQTVGPPDLFKITAGSSVFLRPAEGNRHFKYNRVPVILD